MKCQGCGAHITEKDERCPYCNSYNENYKKPEPIKPAAPVAPAPAPKVVHIYHEAPKRKKTKFSFFKMLLITGGIFLIIYAIGASV